jgi:hypothetical protein
MNDLLSNAGTLHDRPLPPLGDRAQPFVDRAERLGIASAAAAHAFCGANRALSRWARGRRPCARGRRPSAAAPSLRGRRLYLPPPCAVAAPAGGVSALERRAVVRSSLPRATPWAKSERPVGPKNADGVSWGGGRAEAARPGRCPGLNQSGPLGLKTPTAFLGGAVGPKARADLAQGNALGGEAPMGQGGEGARFGALPAPLLL